MAKSLSRLKPFSGEVVRLYEEGKNEPGKDARRALAAVFEKSESYIEFGDATQGRRTEQTAADYDVEAQAIAKNAREEMLLELFRGLTPEQQRETTLKILAQVDANRSIQKHLAGPLRTFSNEQVSSAYGAPPLPQKGRKAKPRRSPGTELDDSHADE